MISGAEITITVLFQISEFQNIDAKIAITAIFQVLKKKHTHISLEISAAKHTKKSWSSQEISVLKRKRV